MSPPLQRFVVCRHAHPRQSEHDPGLTSFGHRAARELGDWVAAQLPLHPGLVPTHLLHTPTTRTRETAEALALALPPLVAAPGRPMPETAEDWEGYTSLLARDGVHCAVLVGHHTTLQALFRDVLAPPLRLRRPPPASAVVVEGTPGGPHWRALAHRAGPLG